MTKSDDLDVDNLPKTYWNYGIIIPFQKTRHSIVPSFYSRSEHFINFLESIHVARKLQWSCA